MDKNFNLEFQCIFFFNGIYLFQKILANFPQLFQIVTEKYRINQEQYEEVKKLFKLFIGRRNYHNFTSGK